MSVIKKEIYKIEEQQTTFAMKMHELEKEFRKIDLTQMRIESQALAGLEGAR